MHSYFLVRHWWGKAKAINVNIRRKNIMRYHAKHRLTLGVWPHSTTIFLNSNEILYAPRRRERWKREEREKICNNKKIVRGIYLDALTTCTPIHVYTKFAEFIQLQFNVNASKYMRHWRDKRRQAIFTFIIFLTNKQIPPKSPPFIICRHSKTVCAYAWMAKRWPK